MTLELYPVNRNTADIDEPCEDVLIIDESVSDSFNELPVLPYAVQKVPIIDSLKELSTLTREPSPQVSLKSSNYNQAINWDHNQWYFGSNDHRYRSSLKRTSLHLEQLTVVVVSVVDAINDKEIVNIKKANTSHIEFNLQAQLSREATPKLKCQRQLL